MHRSLLSLLIFITSVLWHTESQAEKFNYAPSADLLYNIKSSQKGIPVSGEAKVSWQVTGQDQQPKQYRLSSETKVALFGKILLSSSLGSIQEFGLAPERFVEKRFRRDETITYFDRERKLIHFSDSDQSYPIRGGEQDRLSATWQLVGLVRQLGDKFQVGHEWKMVAAGTKDADPWIFKLIEYSKIRTALGEQNVMHIVKAPPPDALGQKLELWLAIDLDFYPVRIHFQDNNGDQVEQKILSITKQTP